MRGSRAQPGCRTACRGTLQVRHEHMALVLRRGFEAGVRRAVVRGGAAQVWKPSRAPRGSAQPYANGRVMVYGELLSVRSERQTCVNQRTRVQI